MDEDLFLGCTIVKMSELRIYKTYYVKFQPYLVQRNLLLHYMDCDSFVLSIRTQNFLNDLQNLEDLLDLSNLKKKYELFSDENKTSWEI